MSEWCKTCLRDLASVRGIPLGRLRAFHVVTREWDASGYEEPPDPGCDVVLVYARTKKAARRLAVRYWRREFRRKGYLANAIVYFADENPFVGLKVYEMSEHFMREAD